MRAVYFTLESGWVPPVSTSTFMVCFLSTVYESLTSLGDGNFGGVQRDVLLRLRFACICLMLRIHFLQKLKTFCFIHVSLLCHPGYLDAPHRHQFNIFSTKYNHLRSALSTLMVKRNVVVWLCYLPRAIRLTVAKLKCDHGL